MAKVAVVFGKSTGVDKMARANIIYTDSEEQWIDTLKKVSGETIAKMRENAKADRRKKNKSDNYLAWLIFTPIITCQVPTSTRSFWTE